ncbi:MAG: hypothetical protein AAF998_14035 [Bacteroidota bacterium]
MIWKHLLQCGTLFASLLLTALPGRACGWDGEWENAFYRFMAPEMNGQDLFRPFQFTWDRLYSYDMLDPSYSQAANLSEWRDYLGTEFSEADIQSAVYKLSADDLVAIQEKAAGTRTVLPGDLSKNALVRAWSKGQFPTTLEYLRFAKTCEPFCLPGGGWGDAPADARGSEELVREGIEKIQALKFDFFRMRYTYQVVRLLQYSDQEREAIARFEEFGAPLDHLDNTLYWWTESHYAGALRDVEREAEAAYRFARVFDHCPSRRVQAYYSWRITSEEQWTAAMALCRNGREKATLHFLRGLSPDAISSEEIRHIQRLDPGSDMADVLLLREINKLESEVLSHEFSSQRPLFEGRDLYEKPEVPEHIEELQELVRETVLGKVEMHDPDLWLLSAVYLTYLSGDPHEAHRDLTTARPHLSPGGALRGSLLDLVFRIARTDMVDASVENTLLKDLTNLGPKIPDPQRNQLRALMDEALAWHYEIQGHPGKALLARRRAYAIETEADLFLVNDLLDFQGKARKTRYERQLVDRLEQAISHEGLVELKGTRLLAKNLLPEAIKVFEALPESYRAQSRTFTLRADPFRGKLRDVIHCQIDCGDGKYNKLTYAKELLWQQEKALKNEAEAAQCYYRLGNAYYNTTYFGPAWKALDYARSGGSWFYLGRFESWYQFDPETFEEVVDMTLAEKYYLKAAEAAPDPEFAARAVFMAAKCELNRFYLAESNDKNDFSEHFTTLTQRYRNTAIYDQLIKECFYFRQFASR